MSAPRDLSLKQIFSTSVLVFALFLVATFISAWNGPPYRGLCNDGPCPPGGNVPAPLNIGPVGQIKEGGLVLNTAGAQNALIVHAGNVGIGNDSPTHKLDVNGNTWIKGQIAVQDGTQGAGKVLTSDASGIASWQSPSTIMGTVNTSSGENTSISAKLGVPQFPSVIVCGSAATHLVAFYIGIHIKNDYIGGTANAENVEYGAPDGRTGNGSATIFYNMQGQLFGTSDKGNFSGANTYACPTQLNLGGASIQP